MTVTPAQSGLYLKIWGAGGSTPSAVRARGDYGGDTTCLELRNLSGPGEPVVVDLGSGARELGRAMMGAGAPDPLDVFLSHLHLDHVFGMPTFAALFRPGATVRFHCGVTAPGDLERVLKTLADEPFFPVRPLDICNAEFHHLSAGETVDRGGLAFNPFPTFHPGGCMGFRIDCAAGSICIVSDHEHGDAATDAAIRKIATGADLLIFDAMYTSEEYEKFRTWGHSTFDEGIKLAKAAGARHLLFHHHLPERDDDALTAIEAQARQRFPATMARQGMTVVIENGAVAIDPRGANALI